MRGAGWLSLVRIVPLLLLASGVWIFRVSDYHVLAQFERGKLWWRSGQERRALDLYESIHKRYPESVHTPEVLWELATIHQLVNGDVERAETFFNHLLEDYPQSPWADRAGFRLAEIYETDLDDPAQAVRTWRRLLEISDEKNRPTVRLRLGQAHFKNNEIEEAVRQFEEILAGPADPVLLQRARVLLGTTYQIQGRYEASLRVFRRVLDQNACQECRLEASLGMVQNYEFLHRLPEAIQAARQIPPGDLPDRHKQKLVARLIEKERLNRP